MRNKNEFKRTTDLSLLEVIVRMLKMAFAVDAVYIIVNNLLAVVNGVSQGVITFATQLFFDAVAEAVTVNDGVEKVILMAAALALTIIFRQIINGVNRFMGRSYFKKVIGHLKKKINSKAAKIPPIAYEDPAVLDDINKASQGAENSLGLLFTITSIFSYYTPYFLFMFVYLYRLEPFLAVALVFVFVPVSVSQIVRNVVFTNLEEEIAPIRRRYDYYKNCTGEKETRILGAFPYFRDLYKSALKSLNKAVWQAEKKVGLIELGLELVTLMGYLGILYLFVRALLKGDISVGAFAAIFASIEAMFGTMNAIVSTHIAKLTEDLGTIKNFFRFLDMPEREGLDLEKEAGNNIRLTDVSFKYPESEEKVVDDISLTIQSGETVAIVGNNGAGKSTLVRLMLGIYKPDTGRVKVAGLNTKKASLTAINKRVSAVFQNYQRYKMTLEDNVKISNLADESEKNPNNVEKVLNEVGLDVDNRSFPQGLDTMLAREFDGVELSLGQWQRVAIARGLYRVHDIIILDEPTAAIDPIEEANIYSKFAEIAEDKTSIIVTHRLGSAKIADRILVMDEGQIVEQGSHEELMELGGKYWNMFTSQAKWYKSG